MKRIVFRKYRLETFHDVRHQVDADQVIEAEHAGLGNTERPPEYGIRLLGCQAHVEGRVQGFLDRIHAHPVAQETRRVVTDDDAFAELLVAEYFETPDDAGSRVLSLHEFEQTHVAHRIKKMRDRKLFAKRFGHVCDEQRNRDRRCIRRHDRPGLANGIDLPVQRLLDVESFDNGFGDPVHRGDPLHVVFDVAGRDVAQQILVQQAGLIPVEQALDSPFRDRIAVGPLDGDVQQHDVDAGVGQLPGDAESHRPCADDGGGFDLVHRSTLHGGVVPEYEIP